VIFITHTCLDHVGGLDSLFYSLACEPPDLPSVRLDVPAAPGHRVAKPGDLLAVHPAAVPWLRRVIRGPRPAAGARDRLSSRGPDGG
jgi:mRNA degradation ribonuclease J1/J2